MACRPKLVGGHGPPSPRELGYGGQPSLSAALRAKVGAGDGNRIHRPTSILRVSACFCKRKIRKSAELGWSFVTLCHAIVGGGYTTHPHFVPSRGEFAAVLPARLCAD